MKIMRFFIFALAAYTASAAFTCADPDDNAGTANAWDLGACQTAGYTALGDDQATVCDAGTDACTGAECCKTPKTFTWTGGDTNAAAPNNGDVTLTFGTPTVVTCNAGFVAGGAATYNRELDADGSTMTGGPCAECANFTDAGCTSCAAGKLRRNDDSCETACDTNYTGGSQTEKCTIKPCEEGTSGDDWTFDCANNGTGTPDGDAGSCTCDCAALDWFSMDAGTKFCTTAATQTWGGDAKSDVPSGNASATFAAATAITVTCTSPALAALTSANNGANGAATYLVNYVGGWKFATAAAPTDWLDTPISCQDVSATFLWTGGDANSSDANGDQQVTDGGSLAVTCNAGYGIGAKGAVADNYTVACTGADTCTTTPANSSCGAKEWDIPNQTLANTNFATGHAAATIAFGAEVAITCNTGWFGADGKFTVVAAGDITTAAPTCTECTAAGATNTDTPAVPANATGTAGTWDCTEALKSGFTAWTCDTGYTKNTAGTACEADAPAASPGSASESAADTESGTSPAFIAGTAIAGIALLL